ncbi:hypothetical protein PAPYR_7949 [Paratrimastix pyriformis]|uniref:Cadherin-like beta-sandwich-like domain-containing protein n=1 Tax=Paratrimastix pyriformis TaxID=342808 RepID=A0ABQ8UFU2_9EUKA|nr:hypothetical protein PAPYR_7949 [Paratrimastix pyriformis]
MLRVDRATLLQVTALPSASRARVSVNGESAETTVPLREGVNVVYINVTSANGEVTQEYMLFVMASAGTPNISEGLAVGLGAGLGGLCLALVAMVGALLIALRRSSRKLSAARAAAAGGAPGVLVMAAAGPACEMAMSPMAAARTPLLAAAGSE